MKNRLKDINETNFNNVAIETFNYQYLNVEVYRNFCEILGKHPKNVKQIEDIPFLPIEFFKTHHIISCNYLNSFEQVFESSGTTGVQTSKHYIGDLGLYKESYLTHFEQVFGKPDNYYIIGLLPSYLERQNSSLVNMVSELSKLSKSQKEDFYLYNFEDLAKRLKTLNGEKVLLFGVTFALLDFSEQYRGINLSNTIIVETGGMKGRGTEPIRAELHLQLKNNLKPQKIVSEYGMTELLSQAYSTENDKFYTPSWLKIGIRDVNNPLDNNFNSGRGALSIIDLANYHSCSFINTQDLGVLYSDGGFNVLGRFDASDVRGCSLLY